MSRIPTPEQTTVLEDKARVRVVKAAPGSGKTWLVAELIRRELAAWSHRGAGIAALSFTRVGGDEIRKAVGRDLNHPHFVGTIDAFIFRYIIRPFLHRCFSLPVMPTLLPDGAGAKHWSTFGCVDEWTTEIKRGEEIKKKNVLSIFSCQYVGEDLDRDSTPILQELSGKRAARILPPELAAKVREEKRRVLKANGLLTHSDAAFQASRLLLHPQFGPAIRHQISQRFPLLIVDELQDTGYFLGKCIRALLTEPNVRGVAVGDPDQAIYEFTGATPELFDEFARIPDAKVLPLATSRRCCGKVVAVAKHLKATSGELHPAPDATGSALLLRYTNMVEEVEKLARALHARQRHSVKIVTRANDTAYELQRRPSKDTIPKLGSQSLTHMLRAVIALRQGKNSAALAYTKAALEMAVFGLEGLSEEKLTAHGIEPDLWRRLTADCLLGAQACIATGTLYEWQTQVGLVLDRFILKSGFGFVATYIVGKLKPKKLQGHTDATIKYLPSPSDVPIISVQTVHAVKGETHEVTVFVCSDSKPNHCPSKVWWSSNAADRERKRIAYVGMTRTKGDLLLCVSEACFYRLRTSRPEFVAAFQTMSVDEFVLAAS